MAGCGIRKGFVYGATAANPRLDADNPLEDVGSPITVGDLHATILSSLGVDYQKEMQTPIGRPLKISEGEAVKDLLT